MGPGWTGAGTRTGSVGPGPVGPELLGQRSPLAGAWPMSGIQLIQRDKQPMGNVSKKYTYV